MRQISDSDDLRLPGDYCIELVDNAAGQRLYLFCILPSGDYCSLPIGRNIKPDQSPSWQWDGNQEQPTLSPSIWHRPRSGHPQEWHGFIRSGRMESC